MTDNIFNNKTVKNKKQSFFVMLALVLTLSVFSLAACNSNRQTLTFIIPDGGTLLPVARMFSQNEQVGGYSINFERISGVAVGSRMNAGTTDIAIAPINLGANVYNSNGSFRLAGIVVWGNNFIMTTNESAPSSISGLNGQILYAFGETAVPGITLLEALRRNDINYNIITNPNSAASDRLNLIFFGDVAELQNAVNANQNIRYFMLPEPNATMMETTGRAKIAFSVQDLYGENYPQAGLFVKSTLIDGNPEFVNALIVAVKASSEFALNNASEAGGIALNQMQSAALPNVNVLTTYIQNRGQTILEFGDVRDEEVRVSVKNYLEVIMTNAPNEGFFIN